MAKRRGVDEAGRRVADLISGAMATKAGKGSYLINQVTPHMGRLVKENPELAARIEAGDPEAVQEAYRWVVANQGFENVPTSKPGRKVELPIPPKDPGTAMIPYGKRGPGVLVGEARTTPQSSPFQPRGTLSVQQKPAPEIIAAEFDKAIGAYRPREAGGLIPYSPRIPEVRAWPTAPRTDIPGSLAGKLGEAVKRYAPLAAAAVGGVAVDRMLREPEPAANALTSPSTNEDLVEETRPAPKVYAEPAVEDMGPPDYSAQAKQLIEKLNAMRRKAGGEVPEAPAMMKEIQRLLDLSNQQRNAPTYRPRTESGDPGEQAIVLMQDLNRRRQQAGGEVPDAPRVLAEIRRLQRLSDERKWGTGNAG